MAIVKEKFLRLFLDEFRENVVSAENQMVVLKNDSGNEEALSTLLRTLHTIKGSSRMLRFTNIEAVVHGAESVFKSVRDGRCQADARLARFFFAVVDRLRYAADAVEAGGDDAMPDQEALLDACGHLAANEPFDLASIPALEEAAAAQQPSVLDEPGEDQAAPGAPASGDSTGEESGASEKQPGTDSSIRVDAASIDRSISLANTLTIRHMRLRTGSELLDSIEKRLTQAYRRTQDPKQLRSEIAELARSIRQYRTQYSEQLFEIEYGTQELRDTVVGMRMLPLATILERFPRMVEETAAELGKDVCLTVEGDSVRLDSTVLAKLADPLIHLVRNAIDHGIESPEARESSGKPRRGTIHIHCRTEGSRISVVVSDDGAGLDYGAIRDRAASIWPESASEIAQMGEDDLVRFLFKPGFTTRTITSALSGRGIGLDIVKTNVEEAKGSIQLESTRGEGSRFTLLLPVSASTMDGMFVQCSGNQYFIPASAIARTVLLDADDCFRLRDKEMFELEGVNIPLYELALGLQLERAERKGRKIPVLLVRGHSEIVGLVVDRIAGYDSLVYQALPPALRGNELVQGVVFGSSFHIIPILNMRAVLDRLRSVRAMDAHRRFSEERQAKRPVVLVVDDSASTREIEVAMLELEGFEVLGAVDGVDALEKLRANKIDLVVSDINMPRMDGLKLIGNMKSDDQFSKLPVVVVSTVDDPAVRSRVAELGADAYIKKSDFAQDDLVSVIRSLLARKGASR